MEALGELISVCRAADTEKVTERKKQIDKLKLLLSKPNITRMLDKCSDAKQRDKKCNKFGWDSLFKVAKNLVWRETEALQKVKDTQTTANVKKKQEICALLKMIVRLANKSGQHLAGSDVVNHVINIMKDDFTRQLFGTDHTSILLKDILSVRKYWSHLETKTWHELLYLYCHMLQDSPSNTDRVMIARVIHVALNGASQQCDLRAKKILPIFEEYFLNVKQESSNHVLEYTVCAVNTLCHTLSTEGRTQICRLGETIFVPLLYLWSKRPSDQLKNQLIEFYQLQMVAHHPHGAQDVEQGMLAVDMDLWKSNLRKLYEAIYNDLQELKTRTKFTNSSRDSDQGILKDNYLRLAADLCHQLFAERSSIIEVTQASFMETQPGGAAKKRRVESGWGIIREVISQHSGTQAGIPWIQLLTVLVERYPSSIPEEEFYPILNTLKLAYSESKKPLVTKWLLSCLVAMIKAQDAMGKELSTFTVEMCQSLWHKVWVTSLRFISLHHAPDDAFHLLASLLDAHLVTPDKDIWSLFLPALHEPTDAAVCFLATYLREYDLPERFTPRSLLITTESSGQCSHPLRRQLLEWLLPSQDCELNEGAIKVTQEKVKVGMLAEVLMTLTLRDTHVISSFPNPQCSNICENRNLNDIEEIYLQTSFDDKANVTNYKKTPSKGSELSLITTLYDLVMEMLLRDTRHLSDTSDPEIAVLESMLHHACLLAAFLTLHVNSGLMTLENAAKSKICTKLNDLLKQFAAHFSEFTRRDVKINPLLNNLKFLFSGCQLIHLDSAQHGQQMAALLRSLIPSELVNLLLDIALDKTKKKKSTNYASTDFSSRSFSHKAGNASAFDDLDLDEFDLGNTEFTMQNDDFDDLDLSRKESQDSGSQGSSQDSHKGSESLFSKSLLNDHDQQRLLVVDILTGYCAYDGTSCGMNNNDVEHTAEVSTSVVSQKLMYLVDPEEQHWDETKPISLQMLQHLLDGLCTTARAVTDEEMEVFQDAIRSVCKKHRRDQDVCRSVLKLVGQLVRQLQDDKEMVTLAKRQARDVALQLIQVFWNQMLNNVYDHQTRLAVVDCIHAFIQCDPEGRWAVWKARNDQEEDLYLREAYPQSLEDRRHKIRLRLACNIQCLFTKPSLSGPQPLPRADQNAMFDRIYTILQNTVTVEGRFTPDEQSDEVTNRTSSLLHALSNMACTSTNCEKKTIFAICQMTKEHNLDTGLVQKVLRQIAGHHGYKSLCGYMTSHMPYVLHHWLHNSYKLQEFPFMLSDCSTQVDFYKAQKSTIIPLLIMANDIESLKALEHPLSTEWRQLVKECIPETLIHILPLFAASKVQEAATGREMQKRLARANSCYEFLIQIIDNEVIERSIVDNMEDIVVKILMSLSESGTDSGEANLISQSPEPNPPCYNTVIITATLDYLTKGHTAKAKSLVSLLAKSQDQIQKVLLSLTVHLSHTHRLPEKYRVLLMYRLFVKLLLQEFHEELGGSWAFVLRQVTYTLLHIIQEAYIARLSPSSYECAVVQLALSLLHNLVQVATESCAQELGRFLPVIISSLIPLATQHGDIKQQSEQVIQFLIVNSHRELKEAMQLLDPLPDCPSFNTANKIIRKLKYEKGTFSLQEEIEHFLTAKEQHTSGSALHRQQEALHLLYDKLRNNKMQLAKLVKNHAEETKENLLVRLVYCLIKLAKSSNPDEAEAAGKCLGEIGPLNLPVIAVKDAPENKCLERALVQYNDYKSKQYCWIFHRLSDYLVDSNIDIVVAASSVLKQVLATKTGISFYTDYKATVRDHLFQYLHPFKAIKKRVAAQASSLPSDHAFCRMLDVDTLWLPRHQNHEQWVHHLVTTIIDSGAVTDEILQLLSPACMAKTGFCEVVLPFIIHDVLLHGSDICDKVLSKHFNKFFEKHCQQYNHKNGNTQGEISQNNVSVKTMLSVVLYLRQQQRVLTRHQQITAWDNNFWLDLDYLPIAQAAHNCASHFTALLLSEIWCDVQREKLRQNGTQSLSDNRGCESPGTGTTSDSTLKCLSQSSQLETLSNLPNPANINVQSLMLEAYRCVGDPDALYGCGAGRLADTISRIKTYEHENNWYKALGSYDLQISDNHNDVAQHGLLQTLQNCGCSHVLDMYLRGLSHQSLGPDQCIQDLQYEAAWRNTNWTLDNPTRLDSKCSFNQALYTSFTGLRDRDFAMTTKALRVARLQSMNAVSLSSLECVRNVYPTLCQLHMVTQAEDVLHFINSPDKSLDVLIEKWESQDVLLQNDFVFTEPVLSERCALLKTLCGCPKQMLIKAQLKMLDRLAKYAREAGRTQLAERAVHELHGLDTENDEIWSWRVEEAWVFWSRGETDTAKHLMKQLIRKLELLQEDNLEAAMLYPKCLGIYGNWLAETKSENPNVIMEQYLCKAAELLQMLSAEDEAALDAYLSLARFADNQYQNIVNHMNSAMFETKQALVLKAKDDADQLRQIGEKNRDDSQSRYLRILDKQRLIDESELASLHEDRGRFLRCALRNYLKCLQAGDKHDLRVFRMTSLWFDNATREEINKQLKLGLLTIKSHKFLPLMYQLAARMSLPPQHGADMFQCLLDTLIERTVIDHPHHTLPIILALAHANKDQEMFQTRSSRKTTGRLARSNTPGSQEEDGEEDRVLAAKAMVERLSKSHRANIIKDLETLSIAYIEMANWPVDKYKKETRPINIPSALLITKIKELSNAVVATLNTKVDPSCQYTDIVYVVKFQSTFKLAGGINLPKIIDCVGSDGVSRRQLVKGKDDLRQDAVMQQVFSMVNNLLWKDTGARRRQLVVRTYKVIPLSQRSGLLEWCEGTVPMGDYLIAAQKGAHERYRPQDWRARKCREAMTEAHGAGSLRKKNEAYTRVCKNFKPVFHNFFMEKFPEPADWYERRLAYTRSVATNSIVGYILGLGDRHVQNILIDTKTAEMIHIDLGVAFEQGRILPTPETVPFRLTRDVVDGMGVAGVEGIFRRCCEKTMEVMRGSHEALITILQVLLYDPLYAWTLSPEKAYLLQHIRDMKADDGAGDANNTRDILDLEERSTKYDSAEKFNRVAERVLLRLQQKLQGVEEGVPLSVSGQVNLLIQDAINPKNLCRLFPGWQPYI